jgi:hypothetical protein
VYVQTNAVGESGSGNGCFPGVAPGGGFVAGYRYKVSSIGDKTRCDLLISIFHCLESTYHSNMSIHCCNSLVCSGLQKLAGNELLQCEHNTILAPDPNSSAAILYRLACIFDLLVSLF